MKYQTYKGQKTKYRKKEIDVIKASFIILVLSAGILNAIFYTSPIKTEISKQIQKIVESPKVEYTKTQFFSPEVTIRLAARQACQHKGLGEQCIEDLVGISYAETRTFNLLSVGDGGKAIGAFQIHLGYHPEITKVQAQDPYWAAEWTLNRMVAKGYPKFRSIAIMSHNGTPFTAKTKGYLNTVNLIALQ